MEKDKDIDNGYGKVEIEFILLSPLEVVDGLNLALNTCIDTLDSDAIDTVELKRISESIRVITRNIMHHEMQKTKQ